MTYLGGWERASERSRAYMHVTKANICWSKRGRRAESYYYFDILSKVNAHLAITTAVVPVCLHRSQTKNTGFKREKLSFLSFTISSLRFNAQQNRLIPTIVRIKMRLSHLNPGCWFACRRLKNREFVSFILIHYDCWQRQRLQHLLFHCTAIIIHIVGWA